MPYCSQDDGIRSCRYKPSKLVEILIQKRRDKVSAFNNNTETKTEPTTTSQNTSTTHTHTDCTNTYTTTDTNPTAKPTTEPDCQILVLRPKTKHSGTLSVKVELLGLKFGLEFQWSAYGFPPL